MGFLRKLFGGGEQQPQDNALYLYIRCNRCNTPVKLRIDPARELAADYGDTSEEGFSLHKEAMDDRCFRVMKIEMQFDDRRRELNRTIEGGTFITAGEYDEYETNRQAGALGAKSAKE